ncbi:MAG: hypothetical protein ABNH00_13425 [Dokdonia sp.]|jgi:hypothetical protein|nr:hypothetical protein [Cytophagaceae bacterium]|tara:strand:- start:27 stop:638 length:612 start_codon:yes stop_codon:yes gene_type:complete
MVDELELLKKDWQRQEAGLPKLTKADIYPMLLKKSSSIVKWIFLISMAEFAFWIFMAFGLKFDSDSISNVESALGNTEIISTIIHFSALIFFMVWFYKNYKKITSTDSSRVLMKNILNTRKTVKYYIWFNVIFLVVGSTMAFVMVAAKSPDTIATDNPLLAALAFLAIMGLFIGGLLLFYRLIYGILLRRLKANYEELKKLEV